MSKRKIFHSTRTKAHTRAVAIPPCGGIATSTVHAWLLPVGSYVLTADSRDAEGNIGPPIITDTSLGVPY